MAIPDYQTLMLPVLEFYQDGREHNNAEALDALAEQFGLSDDELQQTIPSSSQGLFYNRIAWARSHLKKASLLENTDRGVFRITRQGRTVLESGPEAIDVAFLRQFADYGDSSGGADEGKDIMGTGQPDSLAEPFATIFRSWEEANWSFDVMRNTLIQLGVRQWDDPAFAVTIRRIGGNGRAICVNYYSWRVLRFSSMPAHGLWLEMAVLLDEAKAWVPDLKPAFSKPRPDRDIALLSIQYTYDGDEIGNVEDATMPGTLVGAPQVYAIGPLDDPELDENLDLLDRTLPVIKDAFQNWSKSPFIRHHRAEIGRAIFDVPYRNELLVGGVPGEETETENDQRSPATVEPYFTPRTFELLGLLDANPTYATYSAEKEAFQEHLIEPFQQLMHDVAAALPDEITSVMETEKRIFSMIHKNDFGRGGAWPYYWGAFYRKGGKRTADGQLACTIRARGFEVFSMIGESADGAYRAFENNMAVLSDELLDHLDGRLIEGAFETQTGSYDVRVPVDQLLDGAPQEFRLGVPIPSEDVVAMSRSELVELVVEVFQAFFPLVLATIHEDAEPAIREYLGVAAPARPVNPSFPLSAIATQTSFPEADLAAWVSALERKGQAILYGPPGTGKTYVAQQLAKHLIGGGDGFSRLVQFHPAYAYEDFIEGIRPRGDSQDGLSYPIVPGVFRRFCDEARKREGRCVLIIDEINRANLARVFGELMYLLEYREDSVELAVSHTKFSIPANVRILGTMNTADRSIALVDHALRRRFAFIALQSQYDVLRAHRQEGVDTEALISVLEGINKEIADANYALGISFFLASDLSANLPSIWRMEIEPYLDEYFWGQTDKVDAFRWEKVSPKVLVAGASLDA